MSYWSNTLRQRMSRRRALAATSAGAAAAAFLVACGGSSNNKSSTGVSGSSGSSAATGTSGSSGASGATAASGASGSTGAKQSGLVYTPTKSTPQTGGTLKHYSNADIDHFDATISATSQTVALSSEPFYPRMTGLNTGEYPKEADGSSKPETAESWEISPDHLTITFKIRQGMKWDARPPTSGRVLDTQDIMFSWTKFQKLNNASLALSANIDNMSAPDANTIVVKMKAPDASIMPLFSGRDSFYIEPREADGGFDPKKDVRGHGPWILAEYVPSSHFTYNRNPDYFLKGQPYPDKMERPIVTDISTRVAQFRAGNIHTDVLADSPQDIVQTKKDLPKTLLMQTVTYNPSTSTLSTFGWDPGSPWYDMRNRQAASMMIDRESFANVIFNIDKFAADGLDLPFRYNTIVPGGWSDYWLDPTDKAKFGDSAKYLSYDLAEAKKLLSAAGNPNGFKFDFYFDGGPEFGASYSKGVELYANFWRDGGLDVTQSPVTPFLDGWVFGKSRLYTVAFGNLGKYPGNSGIMYIAERNYSTAAVGIYNQISNKGQGYRGMVPPGGTVADGDAKSNDYATKISQEFDKQKQIALVQEMIRYETEQMYYIPRPVAEKSFSLWWPAIGNVGYYVPYPNSAFFADQYINWWMDSSKAPLAS